MGRMAQADPTAVCLLYFEDCPNWRTADVRIKEALAAVGADPGMVAYEQVTTVVRPEALGFGGPPTILVDGADPFADSEPRPGWRAASTGPIAAFDRPRRLSSCGRSSPDEPRQDWWGGCRRCRGRLGGVLRVAGAVERRHRDRLRRVEASQLGPRGGGLATVALGVVRYHRHRSFAAHRAVDRMETAGDADPSGTR